MNTQVALRFLKTSDRLKIGALILGIILLGACQRPGVENRTWQAGESSEGPPIWSLSTDFENQQGRLRIGSEFQQRKIQKIGGIEVENTAQLEILDQNQKPLWITQQRAVSRHLTLPAMTDLLSYRLRDGLVRKTILKNVENEGLTAMGPERLVIAERSGRTLAELRLDLVRKGSGDFFEDSYDLQGERLSRRPAGSHFIDQASRLAQVYPMGPKKSGLSWVPIFVSPGTDTLTSSSFSVTSQSGEKVLVKQSRLSFALDDTRFDQIQVYYFIEDFLQKMKTRHGFELPLPLQVETHVGFPERTNAAFYYRSVLRFGTGDGITYQDLMRDPTIIVHEVGHAVIDAIARLNFEGEAGSINEGFADFLAGSILKTPLMAEDSYVVGPYRRNLATPRLFTERQNKLYADSEIVSSLFWHLREHWGADKAEQFALRVLARLLPNASFADLNLQIANLSLGLPKADQEVLEAALTDRSWK